jgi:hypothetical protein
VLTILVVKMINRDGCMQHTDTGHQLGIQAELFYKLHKNIEKPEAMLSAVIEIRKAARAGGAKLHKTREGVDTVREAADHGQPTSRITQRPPVAGSQAWNRLGSSLQCSCMQGSVRQDVGRQQ